MKIIVRSALLTFAALAAGPLLAENYPTRPIRMIVPWAPGGGSEISARIMSIKLGEQLGATIVQRWQPVERAGLYVPGGKAAYPSSVVMNAVPAQVAGVASVALTSPPQRQFGGAVHPAILGAAGLRLRAVTTG